MRRIPNNRPIRTIAPRRAQPTVNTSFASNNAFQRSRFIQNAMSLSRYAMAAKLGDPRRNLNHECGYPDTGAINPGMLRELYDRNPIAARVVDVMPEESWQSQPTVYEVEEEDRTTPFEAAWEQLGRDLGGEGWHQDEEGNAVWEYLSRADKLCGIGSFGVILLGFNDGKALSEPVEGIDPVTGKALNKKDKVELTFLDDDGNEVTEEDLLAKKTEEIESQGGPLPGQTPEAGANPEEGVKQEATEHPGKKPPAEETEEDDEDSVPALVKKLKPTANLLSLNADDDEEEPEQESSEPTGEQEKKAPTPKSLFQSEEGTGIDAQYGKTFGIQQGPTEGDDGKPKLLFVRVFDESSVQITQYETEPTSPRYGKPKTYLITMHDPRDQSQGGAGLQTTSVNVHWTRVIHVADNRRSSETFGVSRMRTPINRLLDLDKLYGGSAEMYWKGAFPGMSLETHPQLGGDVEIPEEELKRKMEQYWNGMDRGFWTTGLTAKMLSPTVADPTAQIQVQIEAVCILIGIPMRIFMGSERGELASSQDSGTWNDRLRKRQRSFLTPALIVPFVDRLIATGVLPQPTGYSVDWPDMDALSEAEKATVAKTKTEAMSAYVSGGVEAMMAPIDYYTRVLGFSREEAEAIVENAAQAEPLDTGEEMPTDEFGNPINPDGTPFDPEAAAEAAEAGEEGPGKPPGNPFAGPQAASGAPGKGKPPAVPPKAARKPAGAVPPAGKKKPPTPPTANTVLLSPAKYAALFRATPGTEGFDPETTHSFRHQNTGVEYVRIGDER